MDINLEATPLDKINDQVKEIAGPTVAALVAAFAFVKQRDAFLKMPVASKLKQ